MVTTINVIDVYNMALGHIGEESQIASTLDGGAAVEALNTYYPLARQMTLASHLWNFAIKRYELAQDINPPSYGYNYQYTLPADCLRVVATQDQEQGWHYIGDLGPRFGYDTDFVGGFSKRGYEPYVIEDGKLLTDRSVARIQYVFDQDNITRWTPHAIDCLSLMLAHKAAFRITGNRSLAGDLLQIFTGTLPDARRLDGQEGITQATARSSWSAARRG